MKPALSSVMERQSLRSHPPALVELTIWYRRLGHKRSKQGSNMTIPGDKRYERNNCRAWQRGTEPRTMSTHLRMVREDLREDLH